MHKNANYVFLKWSAKLFSFCLDVYGFFIIFRSILLFSHTFACIYVCETMIITPVLVNHSHFIKEKSFCLKNSVSISFKMLYFNI